MKCLKVEQKSFKEYDVHFADKVGDFCCPDSLVAQVIDYLYDIASGFTCEGKRDGVYKQNCTNLFVMCQNEDATFLRCPEQLIYDGVTAQCARKVELLFSVE